MALLAVHLDTLCYPSEYLEESLTHADTHTPSDLPDFLELRQLEHMMAKAHIGKRSSESTCNCNLNRTTVTTPSSYQNPPAIYIETADGHVGTLSAKHSTALNHRF